MNKYTICIINELATSAGTANNVSIRGLYDKHIDALNSIKSVAKSYVQEITLEQDVIIKIYDKPLEEIKHEAPEGCYFLRNESNGCCLYKKEIEQGSGLMSFIYSGTPIIKKIAQIHITNFDLPMVNNDEKIRDSQKAAVEILGLQTENAHLKVVNKELEEKVIIQRESIRILRADKSKLQEEVIKNTTVNVEPARAIERKATIMKEIRSKVGNLSYIEEMMTFLSTQVCEPQQLVQPSKVAELKKRKID